MPTTHTLHFEGKPVRIHHFVDGQPWFDGSDLALFLGYADAIEALHRHCNQQGLNFGSGTRPLRLIDLGNVYRLIVNSPTAQAERFESWLRQDCLPHFVDFARPSQSDGPKLEKRYVEVLWWQGKHWISLSDHDDGG
ncbi:BRO-N domain-containing protein [Stutzerimonas sp. NM35]